MMTTLVAFAIPVAISIYDAIIAALAAGSVTAGAVAATKRYKQWKANNPSTETRTYSGTPLTPTQLYKKKTLTTQEIVPEYVDTRTHMPVEIKRNVVPITAVKPVVKTRPAHSMLIHKPAPSELVGEIAPLILDTESLVTDGKKLYALSQAPLVKNTNLTTGVEPISADQLMVSPPPYDPKDPKWKKWLKGRFTKSGRVQRNADEFLKESAEKLSRVNEPV